MLALIFSCPEPQPAVLVSDRCGFLDSKRCSPEESFLTEPFAIGRAFAVTSRRGMIT